MRKILNGRLGLLAVLALGLFPVAALNSASLNSIGDAIAKVDHAEQLKGNPKLQAPTVTLPSNSRGSLKGKWTSPLVRTFLGIPFAAPPTRDLRWRPPQPAAKWTGVKDASSNPPNCLQPLWPAKNISALTPGTEVVNGQTAAWPSLHPVTSEDCLYLNVFAPPEPADGTLKYSVMFYVSGGQYQFGGAYDKELDGTYMVELGRDVIVVVANSRLGPLGYLGGEALRSRDPQGSTGNYGMLDTRAALKWVQQNIAAFHGDPEKVMVFGESGGAGAVTNTLMMPGGWGLFNRVLMESGAFAQWNTMSMAQAQGNYDAMLKLSGCAGKGADEVQCLVDLPVEMLVDTIGDQDRSNGPPVQNGFWNCEWSPTVDGVELTGMPMELLEKGHLPPGVNIAFGSNKDEGTSFAMTCSLPTHELETTCVREFSPNYPKWVPKTGGHWTAEEKAKYLAATPEPYAKQHLIGTEGSLDLTATTIRVRELREAVGKEQAKLFGEVFNKTPQSYVKQHPVGSDGVYPLGRRFPLVATVELLQIWLKNNFGLDYFGGALETLYLPKASYFTDKYVTGAYQLGQHMAGDFSITCPTIRAAKLIAHWAKQEPDTVSNAYMYWFTHTPLMGRLLATPGVKFLGACHGCEIPFAWATPYYLSGKAEYALASVMSGFWRAFSHSGDPNVAPKKPPLPPGFTLEQNALAQKFETDREEHYGSSVPKWPEFTLETRKNIWFRAAAIAQQADLHSDRCEFWDAWMKGKGMPGFSLDVKLVPSSSSSTEWLDAGWLTAGVLLLALLLIIWRDNRNKGGTLGENSPLVPMEAP